MNDRNIYLVLGIFLMVGIFVNGVAASYNADVYVEKPLDVYKGNTIRFTAHPGHYASYDNCKIVFEITRVIGVYKFNSIGSVPCDRGSISWKANKLPGLYRIRARLKSNGKWISDYSDTEDFTITWTPKCTLKIQVRKNDGSSMNYDELKKLWANIYVDGKWTVYYPSWTKKVNAGTHIVAAKRKGYGSDSKTVTCREGETVNVHLELTKEGAVLPETEVPIYNPLYERLNP